MSRLTPSGPSDGCVGERQDLNAIPHLVRPVRVRWRVHSTALARLAPRRDNRRRAEPRALPGRPYPQPLGLRRPRRVHGLIPVHPTLDDLPARRRRADLRFRGQRARRGQGRRVLISKSGKFL